MDRINLLTYAIMNVNDRNNVDYYDYFVPFIKEVIVLRGYDTISANQLKVDIRTMFGIELPINVVNTILRNKLHRKGYVKNVNNTFKPNFEKLVDSDFQVKKERMLEQHGRLISEIISFAMTKYNILLDEEDAEEALMIFFEKHQLLILEKSLTRENNHNLEAKSENQLEIVISTFIKSCFEKDSILLVYLTNIIKGSMLTNVLYYKSELSTVNMKFKGTEVYFDSTFLIYALGLAGNARQEPCLELLSLLRANNAILRVFRHNIDEIIGILEWCKNNLTRNSNDNHGTISHFINKGYGTGDIDRIIYALEEEIEDKLRIKIIGSVAFDEHAYVISEGDLNNNLKENMIYRRESARERDVNSVSSIMRLRKGKKSVHVESCRAVFVTNNFTLARIVKDYFYNEETPKIIPPVLHDAAITNLVWLKSPAKAPDLPRKRLIAETYAAMQPSEHLWNRYIETLEIYESTNEISEKEIMTLRYSSGAREFLMEKTLGDEDIISIGTIKEILDEIKNEERQKLLDLQTEKDHQINKLEDTIEETKREIAATDELRENKIKNIALKRTKWTTNILFFMISIFIGLLIYLTPFVQQSNINNLIKSIIVLFVITLNVLNLFGFTLLPYKEKLSEKLFAKYESFIKKKYY